MLSGLIGSFIYPLMSLFLVEHLNTPPIYIGVYMISVTLAGLVVSQWMGKKADQGASPYTLYTISASFMSVALIAYAHATHFWQVLVAGILFMSFASALIPQMLTMSRQWASTSSINITEFNSKIRAAISFAWIGGPPLGFSIAAALGFYGSFYMAVICAFISILFVNRLNKGQVYVKTNTKKEERNNEKIELAFWVLGAAILLGSISNITYSSSLPLFTLKEKSMPAYIPGLCMGLVAALEIPVMLYSARLARSISKANLLALSFVFALVFYGLIFFAETPWQFLALQPINACFYGLYAGIGLSLMQEQLEHRIGFTSAFYSNAMKVGMMLGTSLTGLIGQFFSFQFALFGAIAAALLGLACMLIFITMKKPVNETEEAPLKI